MRHRDDGTLQADAGQASAVPLVFPAGKAASGYWAASVPWSDRDGNCLKFRQFVVIAWGAKRWA